MGVIGKPGGHQTQSQVADRSGPDEPEQIVAARNDPTGAARAGSPMGCGKAGVIALVLMGLS